MEHKVNHAHTDIHADWQDSMSDWAAENAAELKHFSGTAHRALPLPAEPMWTAPRRVFVPQGCDQQGRQEPTIPIVIDRLPEAYDQTDSSGAEVLAWLLKGLAVVLLACFSAWCIANYWAMTEPQGDCHMNGKVRVCVVDETK
jgi:hypothetical protein